MSEDPIPFVAVHFSSGPNAATFDLSDVVEFSVLQFL
jgi:hypothetical protein